MKNETTETESYRRYIKTLKTRLFLYGQEGYCHKLFKWLQFSGRDLCLLFFRYRGEKNDSQRSSPTISSFYGWESNCKKSRCEKSLGQDNVRKKMPCIACHPLTFGVSYNPSRSFTWMETCHLAISQNQTGFHVSGAFRAIYSAFHWRRSHQAEKS